MQGRYFVKAKTQAKLCDPELLEARSLHFSRLEALYAGRPLDHAFVLNGIVGNSPTDPYTEPERWVDEALDNLADQSERTMDSVVFRPLVLEFGPYGVHFIDRIFGAHVYHTGDQWWVDCLESPIGELKYPDLDTDDTWQLTRKLAEVFLACEITVPLFGLPTLSSALNVAVNLYGEEFMVAMLTQPDAVHRDLKVINDLLCDLHRWYLANIPLEQLQPVVAAGRCQPPGFGQLCGCSCHLLPADIYAEFIAPLDDELLSVYPNGGMIHLCGVHTQHIPVWREMKSVRAIQINDRASEDLEIYFNELRDDQMIYLNLTSAMTVERAMSITGGRRIVFIADIPEPLALKT
jgi:hypothetical protein